MQSAEVTDEDDKPEKATATAFNILYAKIVKFTL